MQLQEVQMQHQGAMERLASEKDSTEPERGLRPVRNPRFASFRTQPLESLSAAVKLPINKRLLGNPTLGENLVMWNLAMRTGCTPNLPTNIAPYWYCLTQTFREFPVGLGIPPLYINIMVESNPSKPTMLVGGLGVVNLHFTYSIINLPSICLNKLLRKNHHCPKQPYICVDKGNWGRW